MPSLAYEKDNFDRRSGVKCALNKSEGVESQSLSFRSTAVEPRQQRLKLNLLMYTTQMLEARVLLDDPCGPHSSTHTAQG